MTGKLRNRFHKREQQQPVEEMHEETTDAPVTKREFDDFKSEMLDFKKEMLQFKAVVEAHILQTSS